MKKIISLLVIASFIFGLTVFSVASAVAETEDSTSAISTENLEKIPSPEQIKNFRVIKKIGNTLFGIKKAVSESRVATSTSEKAALTLEKISHPGVINQFEKIKKIGTALWGIRKKATSTPPIISPEISTCVATAIDTKDAAIIERVMAAATELGAALSARNTCQKAALTASSTQHADLNACVQTFNAAHKTIIKTSKEIQTKAWDTYKANLKACRPSISNASEVPTIEDGESVFE